MPQALLDVRSDAPDAFDVVGVDACRKLLAVERGVVSHVIAHRTSAVLLSVTALIWAPPSLDLG